MRLIHIHTLELQEFVEGDIPPYAILSHRWTSQELNFKEVYKKRIDKKKKGHRKLLGACKIAARYDVNYLWIDTCCIDKRSSAELSEAINSMFAWYRDAKICLAYLEDVKSGHEFEQTFKQSVWFTRSWTLQELLAPEQVEFFEGGWKYIGSKTSNASLIEATTGIPQSVLEGGRPLWEFSIAARMSWAADRTATRTEDIAYSMMGIFGINIPLLYGEGDRAFLRLQEELLRYSADITLLLWEEPEPEHRHRLLANSPDSFQGAGGKEAFPRQTYTPLTITNVGLEIESYVLRLELEVYGLLVACEKYDGYVMLLRRHRITSTTSEFRKTGIAVVNLMKATESCLRRRVKILWCERSHATEVGRYLGPFGDPNVKYGFTFEAGARFLVMPECLEYPKCSPRPRREPWAAGENQNYLTCTFENIMEPAIANLNCQIGKDQYLVIQVFFDFDSRPCALIATQRLKLDAWEASDSIKESDWKYPFRAHGVRMGQMLSDEGGNRYFLFRASQTRRSYDGCNLPDELTGQELGVRVAFVPEWTKADYGLSWTFKIT